MKTRSPISIIAYFLCLTALVFSSVALAYSADDYLKSLDYQPIETNKAFSSDDKEQLRSHASWIHFSLTNTLPKHGDTKAVQSYAQQTDALPLIESSKPAQEAFKALSEQEEFQIVINKMSADGLFSIEDALIFSRSTAKALYPSMKL